MRSTIDIDEKLLKEAMKLTKARTKRELVHLSLQEIINHKRRQRLADRLGRFNLNLTTRELQRMRDDT